MPWLKMNPFYSSKSTCCSIYTRWPYPVRLVGNCYYIPEMNCYTLLLNFVYHNFRIPNLAPLIDESSKNQINHKQKTKKKKKKTAVNLISDNGAGSELGLKLHI
jgi:accessory gene regulator protein AgrB